MHYVYESPYKDRNVCFIVYFSVRTVSRGNKMIEIPGYYLCYAVSNSNK